MAKFDKYKKEIVVAAVEQLKKEHITDPEGFEIIDAFVTHTLQAETENLNLGGRILPMVAVIAKTTGRVYFFSAKKLLPDAEWP